MGLHVFLRLKAPPLLSAMHLCMHLLPSEAELLSGLRSGHTAV
jgi:hypothetical protein